MKKHLLLFTTLICSQFLFGQVDTTKTTQQDSAIAVQTQPKPPKQRKDNRPINQRIDFGLGTGFWITPSQTYLELAPSVAYRFPKALVTGIGYRYIYRHQRVINNDLNSYGPNVFARLTLTKRIYLWTEYEILNSQYYTQPYVNNEISRKTSTVDSWFVGLGFMRQVGRKGGVSMQILYNVLYEREQNSPYYSAFTYRVGYFF